MEQNRTRGRNVHIYSAKDTSTVTGGLIVTNGMTNSNFYSMVEITYILDKDYKLRYEGGTVQLFRGMTILFNQGSTSSVLPVPS